MAPSSAEQGKSMSSAGYEYYSAEYYVAGLGYVTDDVYETNGYIGAAYSDTRAGMDD